MTARVDFELHGLLILKNLADFRFAETARSGQKPGSRNEIGTVNARAKGGVVRFGTVAGPPPHVFPGGQRSRV
jgi:hypothetical protein